jgi:hypothetical protein
VSRKRLSVHFLSKTYTETLAVPGVRLAVEAFAFDADGGPWDATITAQGSLPQLRRLFFLLRNPLEICGNRAWPCWWGLVQAVTLDTGGASYTLAVDEYVANRIAVAYSRVVPGTDTTEPATTAWADHAESQGEFGILEYLDAQTDLSDVAALGRRDTLLAELAWPALDPQQGAGSGGLSATIYCRGYGDTLDERYYARAAAGESYLKDGLTVSEKQQLGRLTTCTKIYQTWTPSVNETWYNVSAKVYAQRVLSPADSLRISLCLDAAGTPGAVKEYADLLGSALTPQLIWTEFVFDGGEPYSFGTTYGILLERTGAVDPANYYYIGTAVPPGYAGGQLYLWNDVFHTWGARVPAADMCFAIGGEQETTAQIVALVAAKGAYFQGTTILSASGRYSTAYRVGDEKALAVLQDLLGMGSAANRRLIWNVTAQRYLQVYLEPLYDKAAVTLLLDPAGRLVDRRNQPIGPETSPAGKWVAYQMDPLALENTTRYVTGHFYVQHAEYRPGQGWAVQRRNPLDALNLSGG